LAPKKWTAAIGVIAAIIFLRWKPEVQKREQKQSGAKYFSSTWVMQVVHSQWIGKSWKNLLGKTSLKQQNRSFKACGHIIADCNRRGRRNVKFLLCI